MPRPKKEGSAPPKTRSRSGCWPCKARKVKCGEEKPSCLNCQRQGEHCDYSIRLNWDGRSKRKDDERSGSRPMTFGNTPSNLRHTVQVTQASGGQQQGKSRNLEAVLAAAPTSITALPSIGPTSEPPNAPLNDRRELLPPFSIVSSSTDLRRSRSSGSDGRTHPPSSELSSHLRDAAEGMTILPQLQTPRNMTGYPSPIESALETPDRGFTTPTSRMVSKAMPPPYFMSSCTRYADCDTSPDRSTKRVRLNWEDFHQNQEKSRPHRASSYSPGDATEPLRPPIQPRTPNLVSPNMANPMTPASSSTNSDEVRQTWRLASNPNTTQDRDVRRVSVSSLLSGSPEIEHIPSMSSNLPQASIDSMVAPPRLDNAFSFRPRANSNSQTESYGLDSGLPDLDIPTNHDAAAISGKSPTLHNDLDAWLEGVGLGLPEFGFGLQKREFVFAKGGYYASPVPIKIPRKLEPLPSTLLENPMNLLYFHHFLNHTARILVVHDCSQNPFRTILPQMAIKNKNLLNLLLAYSASHRARLLTHPEPANRIAHWVQDVFPSLRHALDDAENYNIEVSDANLATAIMLTSLEIISPSAFGISVPWQNHLNVARRIIRYRGNCLQPVSRNNSIPHFLHLWLAYIDVFGSLSSRTLDEPLFYETLEGPSRDSQSTVLDEDDYTIECMLGFTPHCVPILAQIANLARYCSSERNDPESGKVDHDWQPSPHVQAECDRLEAELERSRLHPVKHCPHYDQEETPTGGKNIFNNSDDTIAVAESAATNDAFHRAALIHLQRRVRNLPQSAPEVQRTIQQIVGSLYKVQPGGSAEACLLFPMFTAGVEAEDKTTRTLILERVKGLEGVGMMQVSRARTLMEKVWETGQEWETLAQGEFFG